MFGRFTGYYTIEDILSYILPDQQCLEIIKEYLPKKNICLFNSGRDALYYYLQKRRKKTDSRYVIIPGWGCPILLAVVFKSGFTPLLLDVNPLTLKMNINEINEVVKEYDVDTLILVNENGVSYTFNEFNKLHKNNIEIIFDNCLSWQNREKINYINEYPEFFSGGFSKPISGLGLGVLAMPKNNFDCLRLSKLFLIKDFLFLMFHIIMQNPFVYSAVQSYIPLDLQTNYESTDDLPSQRSLAVVINSLNRINNLKQVWSDVQKEINAIFIHKKVKSSLTLNLSFLQSKIILEKSKIKNKKKYPIEFHSQYSYDIRKDKRVQLLDSNYEHIDDLRCNYLSLALHLNVIKNKKKFIQILKKVLIDE